MIRPRILVTGAAGFIGFHFLKNLDRLNYDAIGIDNFNDYYDPTLKKNREEVLKQLGIPLYFVDITNKDELESTVSSYKPTVIVHLAAYAGVRYSLEYPMKYIENNIVGTQNLIDICETLNVENVIYASSSSVMTGNQMPWKEDMPTFIQLSPYGYSKRANECQFKVSNIARTIGLRFFTVYGPWGRPDMALFKFADSIISNKPLLVYNDGNMKRDFTYIDDVIQGMNIVLNQILSVSDTMSDIYNIGYGKSVNLMDFIREIELNFNKSAILEYGPMHPADVQETWSDITKLRSMGYDPKIPITEGVKEFAIWYKEYYNLIKDK